MKTYIGITNKGMIAVLSKNKKQAYQVIKEKGYQLNKSSIIISAVHIDYCECEKIN